MTNATNEEARRRYYVANTNRGTARNLEILDEIVALRKEIAELYGVPSFAHYVTKRRMVENPETVTRFLDEVKSGVTEAELRDLRQLREVKAELTGCRSSRRTIERWDVVYYRERLREQRYAVDQEELRKYFPTLPTLHWMLDITERLYGVRFERGHGAGVARGRDLSRRRRRGDRRAASAASTSISIRATASTSTPRRGRCAACRASAGPQADQRAGHELQSRRTDAQRGGDAAARVRPRAARRALADRVQPALRHERGARLRRGAVADVRGVGAPDGEPGADARSLQRPVRSIDESLVQRLTRGEEVRLAASTTGASGSTPASTWRSPASSRGRRSRLWREMEGATPMGHVEGTAFPGTFEHIASGYAAGYYGYMWAKVIALDLISAFGADVMNEATGRRFREMILSARQRRACPRPGRALPRASRFERCVLRRDPRRIDLRRARVVW